ncbi:phasin family protein [Cupriavidus sp. 2MCAB6]|uniref:phasin family protein n=1 Tax=Cupriavidus sp. 2MCAB6 TaxID=3232981 RepID=UPI0005EB9830|nr:hypothetical protein UB46_26505 [Burkholderiaceae bacterium 16]
MAQPSQAQSQAQAQAQFFGFQQANLDLFVALVGPLARGAEKITELNMQAAKASLADGAEYVREASQQSVGGVSGFKPELTNAFGQKLSAYAGHMNEIITATGTEFAQVAQRQMSAYVAQTQEALASLGQNFMSNTNGSFPGAGAQGWVAAYETALKPMREAMESVTASATK